MQAAQNNMCPRFLEIYGPQGFRNLSEEASQIFQDVLNVYLFLLNQEISYENPLTCGTYNKSWIS